jgi:ABC-type Fe3+/spermidine/putrescine transport system ATPase subunit
MLKCEGLAKGFGEILFEDFNLELDDGEIVAITGPSGCGKTTLLRCICGLETLDLGQIILDKKIITFDKAEARGIGLLFQTPVLYPHLNVEKNLRLGGGGDINKALKEVGLEGFNQRKIDKLSGGEAQRVALARALLAQPKILLLDEPFSALDHRLSEILIDEVRDLLKQRKCGAIFVTHNSNQAEKFADRIIKLG